MNIGILGGGQLGRMLALAGYPLGLQFRCLDPKPDAPLGHLADLIVGAYDDESTLERFAQGLDLVTYEFENVPMQTAALLSSRTFVFPPAAALDVAQDRLSEKTRFRELEIPTPDFIAVDTYEQLVTAVRAVGLPSVLKTRRMGYDGKGQIVLKEESDLATAWQQLGGVPLILESFIPFEREVSIIAVRARTGETAFYPVVENVHRDGILRVSTAPAPESAALQQMAELLATRLLDSLAYVGVLAIEFFERGGVLLANEMAPRVHNSGHWTIEGAETSQFENHIRAIAGLPLGSTAAIGVSRMHNILGSPPETADVLRVPGAHLHLYGKSPAPLRKIGHITVTAPDMTILQERSSHIAGLLKS